jgi:hypothetical protein
MNVPNDTPDPMCVCHINNGWDPVFTFHIELTGDCLLWRRPSKAATSLRATKSLYAQLPAREEARRTSAGTVSPPKPAWFRLEKTDVFGVPQKCRTEA